MGELCAGRQDAALYGRQDACRYVLAVTTCGSYYWGCAER
jgi:hypothetical protein